ncbi:MAG TPA: efflux transporter outer membrane subunit [Acetobacteraceae bacterium]|nr:efflux transporter outer membrane subunit [Acetobacteraceae bacterium]
MKSVPMFPRVAKCLPVLLTLSACMVGPDYHRPAAPIPIAYKELHGWTIAQPQDAANRGPWWSIYHDPELDMLERQVNVSNQTVKEFEAEYRNAVALVQEARAGLFPTAGITPGVTRSSFGGGGGGRSSSNFSTTSTGTGSTGGGGGGGGGGAPSTQYSIEGSIDWTPDVWGRIRRQVESQVAAAQVSAADLANAQLSAQMTLAVDYFDLRAEDSLIELLTKTVAAYDATWRITHNQYLAGTSSLAADVEARAQLETTRAQLVGVGVQRALFEHAIAVLTGHPPADLTIPFGLMPNDVPVLPPGLPSTLLERLPSIAAAERQMQEENALIGYQIGAFYPNISLSTLGGFAGGPLSQLFTASNALWSLGASASETVFQGGARSAAVAAARATYDQSVANYRQTVLSALQTVEDELASLRILAQQSLAERVAVDAAQKAVDVLLNQYRAGTVDYTSVVTQQTVLLGDQETALSVQQSRLVASVDLVTALGGGWTTGELPNKNSLQTWDPTVENPPAPGKVGE